MDFGTTLEFFAQQTPLMFLFLLTLSHYSYLRFKIIQIGQKLVLNNDQLNSHSKNL